MTISNVFLLTLEALGSIGHKYFGRLKLTGRPTMEEGRPVSISCYLTAEVVQPRRRPSQEKAATTQAMQRCRLAPPRFCSIRFRLPNTCGHGITLVQVKRETGLGVGASS